MIAGSGTVSGTLWWSVMITSIPSSPACFTSSIFEIPQSTVIIKVPY